MGDDPIIPELNAGAASHGNGSAATGGSSYAFHYGLSKGGSLFVVVAACLALGLSIGAVVISAVNGRESSRAEREARMLEYYVNILNQTLNEQHIVKPEQNYLQFKKEHSDGER